MRSLLRFLPILLLYISCNTSEKEAELGSFLTDSPSIEGKPEYLASPYVTAGDRAYMVGYQDGSFPELGWHIEGEMGGIWNHPIKLADGFTGSFQFDDKLVILDSAISFTNYPMANVHKYAPIDGLKVERWQMAPDGLPGIVVQYIIQNTSSREHEGFFTLTTYPDLRPTWLAEDMNVKDGNDTARFLEELAAWMVEDQENPWYLLIGANQMSFDHLESDSPYKGSGKSLALSYKLDIPPGERRSYTFVIAGSAESKEEALNAYQTIHGKLPELTSSKRDRYEKIALTAELKVPDKDLEEAFEWLKYNSDWLVRRVPGIGTGIGAGIPDYPWWFGVDSEYALRGYMAVGLREPVYETIALLDSVSKAVNGNGRIIHEMSTNGKVFNPGNINETPQFASLVWEVFKWNGDLEFLKRYFPTIESGMDWLLNTQDKNGNLFPDGFGMMEIHGLDSEMIDVASYTQRALADASKMAQILGKKDLAGEYSEKAELLRRKINEEFWSEKFGSYADFIGTGEQALKLIDDAIIRADTLDKPWAVKELQQTRDDILKGGNLKATQPFVVHHNWVVNTPMEMGIADSIKAMRALGTAERFVNPYGVFVTGIDRDETAGEDASSFSGSKVFSYTGAVMTLPTGVQAVAENNYGRPDKALDYLKRMTRSFSYALPGSMYEVSPDYGMMTQAWNIYAFAIPIIQQFFGIQPNAYEKVITINPQMPTSWDHASIDEVPIADQVLDMRFLRDGKSLEYLVKLQKNGWKLKFMVPPGHSYEILDGNSSALEQGNGFFATGKSLHVRIFPNE